MIGSVLCLPPLISACTTVPLAQTGSLSSYERLAPTDSLFTNARVNVNKDAILAAKTAHIIPTSFASGADQSLSEADRRMLANAVNRAVCVGLSDRFQIVSPPEVADVTVHVSIAGVVPTDEAAAAASKVISVGTSVVTATGIFSTPIPIPSLRVPIGLGGIALEAEAVDPRGDQIAAMLWARGANSLAQARVSPIGDAYEFASAFAADFSELLVTGSDPFTLRLTSIPSMETVVSLFGGAPKEAACDAYGRLGVANMLAGTMGLPPEWTDRGPQLGADR
ncbi:MAG: DUF3313 domain-containing protein [Hyphomicrobium sp.]|jgi:hypothetical protein